MQINVPDGMNLNDLIAALNAGVEAIGSAGNTSDPMRDYNRSTLREFRDAVVRDTRK
jgi:hypothetical protein